jgi:PPOX class probable F420-dependent enzyme
VARLATVRPDGAPHLVPIVFAVVGDVIYSAVDAKPKRHTRLQRLANIAHEPRVSVLVDRYDDDWTALWWVRADGVAQELPSSPAAVDALAAKYPQYRAAPPAGPFLEIHVRGWSAWSASA